MTRYGLAALALAVFLSGRPAATLAQPAPAKPNPWTEGTTKEARERAKAIFARGNELFLKSQFGLALNEYTRAVALWDHPSIRYNMAVCLIHLDRDTEALANLERSLRWGAAPFERSVYIDALAHRKMLERRLMTTLEVVGATPMARVLIDGKAAFVAPGAVKRRVLPGKHIVEARLDGHDTYREELTVRPGADAIVTVRLRPSPIVYRRKFSHKIPWLVAGAGVGLLAMAGGFEFWAQFSYDAYDRGIEVCGGCDAKEQGLDVHASRARIKHGFAVGSLVLGGVALISSVALFAVNQPRPERVQRTGTIMRRVVTPVVTPERAGVMARWLF